MDYGDYYWGLYRDYKRDPFPPFPTKNQGEHFSLQKGSQTVQEQVGKQGLLALALT